MLQRKKAFLQGMNNSFALNSLKSSIIMAV